MKQRKWLALLLVIPLFLTSCSEIFDFSIRQETSLATKYNKYFEGISTTRGEISVETEDLSAFHFEYSERELDTSYNTNEVTRIVFSNGGTTVYGKGAESKDKDATITAAGTYIIGGSAKNALLTVDAEKEGFVHLVLSGLSLSGKDGTAIDIRSASSVLITTVGDSALSDSAEYKPSALDKDTAVILSRVDLAINGTGTLEIDGYRSHGIASLGSFAFTSGKIRIRTTQAGIIGEGSVRLGGGELHIRAEEEGILSGKVLSGNTLVGYEKPTETEAGYVYISDGIFHLVSTGDAIRSASVLLVEGGITDMTTGRYLEDVKTDEEEEGDAEELPSFWEIFEKEEEAAEEEKTFAVYANGISAASDIVIRGGTLAIDASNHAVYSDKNICVDGGRFLLDAIHEGLRAEGALGISDGILIIEGSQCGMFGKSIDLSGGHIYIEKSDSGVSTKGAFRQSGGVLAVAGAKGVPLDFGVGTVTGGIMVALGNAEVAREFFPSGRQGVVLCRFEEQRDGYPLIVCDNDENVLLSLESRGKYSTAYLSTPDMKVDRAYTLMSGGFVPSADRYGFAVNAQTMIGAEPLTVVAAKS